MLRVPLTRKPALRRIATLTVLACSALALNGCGGGSRAAAYKPTKMISFGDENSLIDSFTSTDLKEVDGTTQGTMKGLVYTVNTLGAVTSSYGCAETGVASSYTACDSTNGSTALTEASTDTIQYQWFVKPASANVLTRVAHDTTQGFRRDAAYTWTCSGSVIWTQYVAHGFRLGYASYNGQVGQCPTDSYSNAYTYAAYQAKSADVITQITSHLSELDSGTLVTVMVGQWDIYEMYQAVIASSKTQAEAEALLATRATALADAIIQVLGKGAKVVVALTPDLGESPLAYNASQRTLLKALTTAFNNTLYIDNLAKRVTEGGRVVAGVNPETITDTSTRSSSYTFAPSVLCPAADDTDASGTNVLLDPVGNKVSTSYSGYDAFAAVKFCSWSASKLSGTLLSSLSSTYIWADQVHFSSTGHYLIGSSAYSRAYNQF